SCLFLFAVAVAPAAAHSSHRTKRGLLELAGAIKCSTGRSALAYMMYGCYCGLGGEGWPRDRADW
uniref:Phospholipase A2 n=1 Tax=Poecilia latipinna TaxID=48699 RepID=A0A3B3USI8_9TELE